MTSRSAPRETPTIDGSGTAEGDRVVGVRVAHGWDADTATPLVLLQLRTDVGDVGLVSMTADLALGCSSTRSARRSP